MCAKQLFSVKQKIGTSCIMSLRQSLKKMGIRYIAYCPKVPGANGQGKTIEESKESLATAISLILEDRRENALRGLPVPDDAIGERCRDFMKIQTLLRHLCCDGCASRKKADHIHFG